MGGVGRASGPEVLERASEGGPRGASSGVLGSTPGATELRFQGRPGARHLHVAAEAATRRLFGARRPLFENSDFREQSHLRGKMLRVNFLRRRTFSLLILFSAPDLGCRSLYKTDIYYRHVFRAL